MRFSVAAFALVALAAVTSCTNGIGVSCPPGKLVCNDQCVSIVDNVKNCGGCGVECPGQIVCIGGQCTCPKDQQNCDNVCVRADRDPKNCGACKKECEAALLCSAGQCVISCPTDQTNCNGGCVDTMTDSANCGGCDMPCATGKSCVNGECQLLCENNLKVCGNTCVDTQNDPKNCGDCAQPCETGQFCAVGECVAICPAQFIVCPGPPVGELRCVDPQTDPFNCGGCGVTDVQPGNVDLGTGPILPHVCMGTNGANTDGVCVKGLCAYACQKGFGVCNGGGTASSDVGPPPLQDNEPWCAIHIDDNECNCGGCGIACGGGRESGGWYYKESNCISGNSTDSSEICCDAMCQPAENFLSNTSCGSCASVTNCGGGATCCEERGSAGMLGGVCVDLNQPNKKHCGLCADNCEFAFGIAGQCCDNGDGDLSCVDGSTIANCGGCGIACTGVSPGCCPTSTVFTCSDFGVDPSNCGGCNNDCDTICAPATAMGCGAVTPGVCDCTA